MTRKEFPTFLSYSGFRLYKSCNYAYKLRYKDRKKPAKADCRPFFAGSVAHSCMEVWVKNGMPEGGISKPVDNFMREYLASNFVRFHGMDDFENIRTKIVSIITEIENIFKEKGWTARKWLVEMPNKVWVKQLGAYLYGRLDLVSEKNFVGFDLKATANKQYLEEDQCIWYSMVASISSSKPMETFVWLVPLMKEKLIVFPVSREMKVDLYNRIKLNLEAMRSGAFDPSPTKSKCFRCELSEFCEHKYSDSSELDYDEKDGKRMVKL